MTANRPDPGTISSARPPSPLEFILLSEIRERLKASPDEVISEYQARKVMAHPNAPKPLRHLGKPYRYPRKETIEFLRTGKKVKT